MHPSFDWKKYVIALFITLTIFGSVVYISTVISDRRIAEVRAIQEKVTLDIASSETQFNLLKELSCNDIDNSILSSELNSLAERLTILESSRTRNNTELLSLKRAYSLLQSKDYLLSKEINKKCGLRPVTILYFYSNEGDCPDCEKEGYVLTFLRQEYPQLRIYSFDYNLDLSAVHTLSSLFKITPPLPALVIKDKAYSGFQSLEQVEKLLPELAKMKADREAALIQKSNATSSATGNPNGTQ